MSQNSVLIVFHESHLKYSPTTLELINKLSLKSKVYIFAKGDTKDLILNNMITPLNHRESNIESFLMYITQKIDGIIYRLIRKRFFLAFIKIIFLSIAIKKKIKLIDKPPKVVIGIDNIGFLSCIINFEKAHYLSLEIYESDLLNRIVQKNYNKMESLGIQSYDRLKILFSNYKGKVHLIPNSPLYIKDFEKNKRKKNNIIYLGSFIDKMGSKAIIKFALDYPQFNITIKGIIPDYIINKLPKNCTIDREYVLQKDLPTYLSQYEFGFSLYDKKYFQLDEIQHFENIPSGKIYNYFNAGLPIICSNFKGLSAVKLFKAGILLDELESKNILRAINIMREDYRTYVDGCRKAAKFYNIDDYLESYSNDILK